MPSDLPPQNVIIHNANQSGGSNVGIQNNFGAMPRKLSDEQMLQLEKALATAAPLNPHIEMYFGLSDGEVADIGNQLAQAMRIANLKPNVMTPIMYVTSPPPFNVQVYIDNPAHVPPAANVIANAFKSVGLKVDTHFFPGLPVSERVQVVVGPQK
jgi:hypothetical protein